MKIKWQKQNGSKCTNRNTFLDFFFLRGPQEVLTSGWRTAQSFSYFEPQSLRILNGSVRGFGWDILLGIELKNVFFFVVTDHK